MVILVVGERLKRFGISKKFIGVDIINQIQESDTPSSVAPLGNSVLIYKAPFRVHLNLIFLPLPPLSITENRHSTRRR
jgi:hypothetical protein